MELSVIIPVYNEERNIFPLYDLLKKHIPTKTYEIIFINDGSRDKTKLAIEALIKKDKTVSLINFRKNFGKADALTAGFGKAKGNILITMDGDLQDDPQEIQRFIEKINEGYDLVSGWKFKRHDPFGKTIPSKIFNKLTSAISGLKINDFNCGFKAYKKETVKTIRIYGELHRYIPALAHWQGYRVGEIKVKHHKRLHGKSKYGITRLLKGFFDLLTIKYLSTYKSRPLHLFGSIGLICTSLGTILGLYLLNQWMHGIGIGHRPLLTLAILLVVIGVQFISTGLIAEMITNNFYEESSKK